LAVRLLGLVNFVSDGAEFGGNLGGRSHILVRT
jgi:hypothetical protein